MKALVQSKVYPLQVTSTGVAFNLNNRDWHLLDGRINEENTYSMSTIELLYPPGGAVRDISSIYYLSCASDIPGVPVAEIEKYDSSNKITARLNSSTDKWVAFPLNTWKMADFSFSPSNVYGNIVPWDGKEPYVKLGVDKWTDQYARYIISPSWITPNISNIAVNQLDPRLDIAVTWQSNIQDLGDIEVWQNGVHLRTIEVGSAKGGIIPAYAIPAVGQFTIKVIAANNPMEDLGTTGTASANFTAAVPAVTASNLQINQTERRSPIIGTWDSTNQSDFKLEVLRGEVVEYMLTGTTQRSFSIPPGTLDEGDVVFKLTVNNTFGAATSTVILNQSKTITFSRPAITSLEPDGLNQNLDLALPITWLCANQDTYNLKVYRETVLEREFSGTSDKGVTLPPKTIKTGQIKLVLTVTNTINGIVGTTVREAEFFGYGTPDSPVFEDVDVYNKALPLISWVSPEQEWYEFKISTVEGVVHEQSGEVLSTSKSYQVTLDLLNNTQYVLALRIKSSFGLWSNWTEKTVLVSYTNLTKPVIGLVSDVEGNIIVTIQNPDVAEFWTAEIWRREDFSDWVRLVKELPPDYTWSDTTAAAMKKYYYKCVANSTDGGRTQSDTASIEAEFEGYYLIDVEEPNKKVNLMVEDSKDESPIVIDRIGDEVFSLFAGATKPIVEKGIVNYSTGNMNFLISLKDSMLLADMKTNSKLLLYKDERGNKMYGTIQGNITENPKRWFKEYVDVSFRFTENDFLEQDIASNVKMYLHLFDGTWKFDGSIDLSGRHWEVIS